LSKKRDFTLNIVLKYHFYDKIDENLSISDRKMPKIAQYRPKFAQIQSKNAENRPKSLKIGRKMALLPLKYLFIPLSFLILLLISILIDQIIGSVPFFFSFLQFLYKNWSFGFMNDNFCGL
jgi:hypothetical protein